MYLENMKQHEQKKRGYFMDKRKKTSKLFNKIVILCGSFVIILLFVVGFIYFQRMNKEKNEVFTKGFKSQIIDTYWGVQLPFSIDDFNVVYKKLQKVSLTETKDMDETKEPFSPFWIVMVTQGNNYTLKIFDDYIKVESNYHLAANMLGTGKPKATYYKTSKNLFADKEIKDLHQKYLKLLWERGKNRF